ncbi:hypothetical protein GS466_02325 [Rhodococcus hoagii]|nr:hypothetical protein [Prescottella equi]
MDVSPLCVDWEDAKVNLVWWRKKAQKHPGRYRDTEFIIAEVRGNA